MIARFICSALLLASIGSASAGLFDDDEARLAIRDLRQTNVELRQQLETLKRESDQKNADLLRRTSDESVELRRSLMDLQNQLESTKADLAKMRGQEEQISRDLSDLQRRQKDVLQATEERLRKLEPTRVSLDGRDFMAEPSEKRDFDNAMAVFRKGEFANAQVVFVDFMTRYSQSGYRPSALFWLGNSQYATKDYKEAMANFRSLISLASDHLRVPEAALAIANCQLELKEFKAARKTLEELVSNHPGTEAAAAAKDRLARFK
jgi:tol-pal system protein YbgF